MKKLLATLIVALFTLTSFAQTANVSKAERFLQEGNLAGAKEAIDEAQKNEKTKDKNRTLFTYAKVYEAIALSNEPNFKAMREKAFEEAMNAFEKLFEMEKENSSYYLLGMEALNSFWGGYFNMGAEAFNDNEYMEAYQAFEYANRIISGDTSTILYAGIAAQQAEEYGKALKKYYELVDLKYYDQDILISMIYLERTENNDLEKALQVCRIAKREFPDNPDFVREEINILVNLDRLDDAKQGLIEAIRLEPNNGIYYFNLGVIDDNAKLYDEAEKNYKKAIELMPDHFESNFNLGAIYYNRAVEIVKEANNMDLDDYQKNGKALEEKGKVQFRLALPYLEKALVAREDDLSVLETLQTLYGQLGMLKEAEKVSDKLKSLGVGG